MIEKVKDLSDKELDQLALIVQQEKEYRAKAKTSVAQDAGSLNLWHRALVSGLQSHGITVPAFFVFSKTKAAKTLAKHLDALDSLAGEFISKKSRWSDRHVAREIVIDCLAQWLLRKKVPVSIGSICGQAINASAAVADQFPGYRQGGLLPFVLVQRMTLAGQ